MKKFLTSRARSFKYAFAGWAYVLRTQQNTWIHAFISVVVVLAGIWLGISRYDWIAILLAMAMVWVAEFLNTALEAIVDLAVEEQHPLAKAGKDVGAAAVLITALAAVVVGILVFGPPLWQRLLLIFPG